MKTTTIQSMSVARLRPFPRNALTHSEQQVRQIADRITRFGFTDPILIDGAPVRPRCGGVHGLLARRARRHRARLKASASCSLHHWQQLTDQGATLATSGQSFADIAAQRRKETKR